MNLNRIIILFVFLTISITAHSQEWNGNESRDYVFRLGKVTIGGDYSGARFNVVGSKYITHFHHGPNENTYIRPGKGSGMVIMDIGKVAIGTTKASNFTLGVNGSIGAKSVNSSVTNWPDFVFEKTYNLMSLRELERYIAINKHLPDIPSEVEVYKNGIELGEMNAKLLRKIEELTLYLIEQNKEINSLKKEIEDLKSK